MKTKHFGRQLLCLTLTLMMLFSLATPVFADNVAVVAKDDAGNAYTSISAAWNAAKSGKVITMKTDWKLSDRLVLDDGESATIDMNGLRIDRGLSSYKSDGEVFYLDEGASLTLKSTVTTTEHKFSGGFSLKRKASYVR